MMTGLGQSDLASEHRFLARNAAGLVWSVAAGAFVAWADSDFADYGIPAVSQGGKRFAATAPPGTARYELWAWTGAPATSYVVWEEAVDGEVAIDTEALAEEISGQIDVGNPVVLPLQVANPRTGTPTKTIPALSQGLGRTDVLGPFLDANGAAVDLSSKALRLVFFSVDEHDVATGRWKYETGAGLTVTGDSSNQVQVAHDGDKHDVPGCYRYVLVNVSDDVPLLKGTVEIEATAEDA